MLNTVYFLILLQDIGMKLNEDLKYGVYMFSFLIEWGLRQTPNLIFAAQFRFLLFNVWRFQTHLLEATPLPYFSCIKFNW